MSKLRFRSTIEINGVNPYVLVSPRRAAQLQQGWRKPLPVRIRVNAQPKIPWRVNLMPVGDGSFYLYLHGVVRQASRTKVGDLVTVEVEFDADYQGGPPPMPPWFRTALSQHPRAQRAWKQLIPSRQKEILRYLCALKSPEAQTRNTQRALRVLAGAQQRFMARSWNDDSSSKRQDRLRTM